MAKAESIAAATRSCGIRSSRRRAITDSTTPMADSQTSIMKDKDSPVDQSCCRF